MALEARSDSRMDQAAEPPPARGGVGSWDLKSLLDLDPELGAELSDAEWAEATEALRTVALGNGEEIL